MARQPLPRDEIAGRLARLDRAARALYGSGLYDLAYFDRATMTRNPGTIGDYETDLYA